MKSIKEPFPTISINEFQKKYLGGVDNKAMKEQCIIDILQEVAVGDLNSIKANEIIKKILEGV